MKIGLLSDVHAEFYRREKDWMPPLPDDPDVLVLAGDIHVGKGLIGFVERISEALPQTQIILVAGNHEFYNQRRVKTLDDYEHAFADHERIHFLENDYVEIGGVRFIGATLWTGFPLHRDGDTLEEVMTYARETISDFSLIVEDGIGIKAFSPEHARELFLESKAAIETMLEQSNAEKNVVITHFPPTKNTLHTCFETDLITSYFTADCLDLIEKYQPAYWFYGHNHWSASSNVGLTKVISNQFGYPNERWKMGGAFNENLLLPL